MKSFTLGVVLIFWMVLTIILAASIIGIVVLIREDHNTNTFQGESGEAVWFRIGRSLVDKLIQ